MNKIQLSFWVAFLSVFASSNAYSEPRTIILAKDRISINGSLLKFGDHVDKWRAAIGSGDECSTLGCEWIQHGLLIHMRKNGLTRGITIVLNPEDRTGYLSKEEAKKMLAREPLPFRGRLRFETVDIDSRTRFSDVRDSLPKSSYLQCGIRNCEFPSGHFGEVGGVFVKLIGLSEDGYFQRIAVFTPEL